MNSDIKKFMNIIMMKKFIESMNNKKQPLPLNHDEVPAQKITNVMFDIDKTIREFDAFVRDWNIKIDYSIKPKKKSNLTINLIHEYAKRISVGVSHALIERDFRFKSTKNGFNWSNDGFEILDKLDPDKENILSENDYLRLYFTYFKSEAQNVHVFPMRTIHRTVAGEGDQKALVKEIEWADPSLRSTPVNKNVIKNTSPLNVQNITVPDSAIEEILEEKRGKDEEDSEEDE